MEDDYVDANYEWAALEEIRNESISFTSMCNCSKGDGDGPPCPHGHAEYVAAMRTEADRAKELLKEWTYEAPIPIIIMPVNEEHKEKFLSDIDAQIERLQGRKGRGFQEED